MSVPPLIGRGPPLAALSDRIQHLRGRVRGTTPFVVTWLTAETGNRLAAAFYLIVAAAISLCAVLTLRETAGQPLPQTSDPLLASAIQ